MDRDGAVASVGEGAQTLGGDETDGAVAEPNGQPEAVLSEINAHRLLVVHPFPHH